MSNVKSALYSPYGAYELKSKYQRNFGLGSLSALSLVLVILLISWLVSVLQAEDDFSGAPAVTIKTIAELGPPPTIAKKPPQVKVEQVNVAAPKVGIPRPVADDEVLDDDVVLATRDELAEIVAPDMAVDADDDQEIIVDIDESEYLPSSDEFVPVEVYPEMIFEAKPDYPRLAKQAGIEGVVYVEALVSKDGEVLQAQVAKSSGTESLDEAAVETAYKNKFRPGIQNGRPVAIWVTYKVDFVLDN